MATIRQWLNEQDFDWDNGKIVYQGVTVEEMGDDGVVRFPTSPRRRAGRRPNRLS